MKKSLFLFFVLAIPIFGLLYFYNSHDLILINSSQSIRPSNSIKSAYVNVGNSPYLTGIRIVKTPLPHGCKWIRQPESASNMKCFPLNEGKSLFLESSQYADFHDFGSRLVIQTTDTLYPVKLPGEKSFVSDFIVSPDKNNVLIATSGESENKKDSSTSIYNYKVSTDKLDFLAVYSEKEYQIYDLEFSPSGTGSVLLRNREINPITNDAIILQRVDFILSSNNTTTSSLEIKFPHKLELNKGVLDIVKFLPIRNVILFTFNPEQLSEKPVELFSYSLKNKMAEKIAEYPYDSCNILVSQDENNIAAICVKNKKDEFKRAILFSSMDDPARHHVKISKSIPANIFRFDPDNYVVYFWAGKYGEYAITKEGITSIGIYSWDIPISTKLSSV